jgi:DNA-binding transcriptional LysR family regulator
VISLVVYFSALWLWNLLRRKERFPEQSYHVELPLIENEYLRITLVEDELDLELTALNDAWTEKVYNEETCLYRAKSNPVIPELENKIVAFYVKEQEDGVILQVLEEQHGSRGTGLNTELVFLTYKSLHVSRLGSAGPFYLFNDKKNDRLILGISKTEKLKIELGS